MIEQQDFFKKYRIDKEAFESANIDWKELVDIHEDYVKTAPLVRCRVIQTN